MPIHVIDPAARPNRITGRLVGHSASTHAATLVINSHGTFTTLPILLLRRTGRAHPLSDTPGHLTSEAERGSGTEHTAAILERQ